MHAFHGMPFEVLVHPPITSEVCLFHLHTVACQLLPKTYWAERIYFALARRASLAPTSAESKGKSGSLMGRGRLACVGTSPSAGSGAPRSIGATGLGAAAGSSSPLRSG